MHIIIMHMLIEPMLMYVFDVHVWHASVRYTLLKHLLNVYGFVYSIGTFVLSLQ